MRRTFTDQIGAQVRLQRSGVQNLVNAIGLHCAAEAKFQRPAPLVGDQVAAQVAARLAQHGEKSQVQRGGRSRRCQGEVLSGVAKQFSAAR